MRSDNRNETITHLGMPQRRIPVLTPVPSGGVDGFVSFKPWDYERGGNVRRVSPEILAALRDPAQRKRVEQQYGRIEERDWSRLLELLGLIERLAAGDWTPVYKHLGSTHKSVRNGNTIKVEISSSGSAKSAVFALTEAFTEGLSRSRFVVWWAEREQKFAPGIYCEDIVTALYALVLSAVGQPGGIGICRHCEQPFPRSRSKQRYCSYRCQAAAGMRRYRLKLKKAAKSKSRFSGKPNKRPSRRS
jgi:hypothetical protein